MNTKIQHPVLCDDVVFQELPLLGDKLKQLQDKGYIRIVSTSIVEESVKKYQDYKFFVFEEATSSNSFAPLIEKLDHKYWYRIIIYRGLNNTPWEIGERAFEILNLRKLKNADPSYPVEFVRQDEIEFLEKYLPIPVKVVEEPAAYIEVQIIDPKGKRRRGDPLLLNHSYILRTWIRRKSIPNDKRQLIQPGQHSGIDGKQIDVVFYSPDNVNVDNFAKTVIMKMSEQLFALEEIGDYVDFLIRPIDSYRDYITFCIDLNYRHVMIGWIKFRLPIKR